MSEYDKREARWEAAVDRVSKMADFAALRRAAMGADTSSQFGPGGSENIAPFNRLAEAMERVSKNPGAMKDLNDRGLYWGEKQGWLMRYESTRTAPTHWRPLNAMPHDIVVALNNIEGKITFTTAHDNAVRAPKQKRNQMIDQTKNREQERKRERELATGQWNNRVQQGQAKAASTVQVELAPKKTKEDEEKDRSGREV